MIAATPNERVCLQNYFDTGSGGYWVRRMRQLPRAPLKIPIHFAVYVFLEITLILGEK